jgi:hypothetical protein
MQKVIRTWRIAMIRVQGVITRACGLETDDFNFPSLFDVLVDR